MFLLLFIFTLLHCRLIASHEVVHAKQFDPVVIPCGFEDAKTNIEVVKFDSDVTFPLSLLLKLQSIHLISLHR